MSNLPPGVTGMEPQITGEIEFDPHAPFWAGEFSPGEDEGWAVFFRDEEDPFLCAADGHPPWTRRQAERWSWQLNKRYAFRNCEPDKHGVCRVCGDLLDYPPLDPRDLGDLPEGKA